MQSIGRFEKLKTYSEWYKRLNDHYSRKDRPENFEFLDIYEQFRQSIGYYVSYLTDEPVIAPPVILQLNLTFRCNYKCTMCSISGTAGENLYSTELDKDGEMDIHAIYRMLEQAQKLGAKEILILGGEPLLYEKIYDVISYSRTLNLEPTLITNASLVSEEVARKLIEAGLPSLRASLDGATAKTHNDVRGIKKGFEKTVQGIKNMIKVKKEMGTDYPYVGITFTIMNRNANEIIDVLKLGIDLELDGLNFQPVIVSNTNPYNYYKKEGSPLWPTDENVKNIVSQIDELILFKEGKKDWLKRLPGKDNFYYLENPTGHLMATQKYFKQELTLEKSPCYAGFNRLQITQYGQLYLCSDVFGDAYKDDIKELFFSERAKKARKLVRKCKTPCAQWCSFDVKSRVYVDNIPDIANFYFAALDRISTRYPKQFYYQLLDKTRDLVDDCSVLLNDELGEIQIEKSQEKEEIKRQRDIEKALLDIKTMYRILDTRKGIKVKVNLIEVMIRKVANRIIK